GPCIKFGSCSFTRKKVMKGCIKLMCTLHPMKLARHQGVNSSKISVRLIFVRLDIIIVIFLSISDLYLLIYLQIFSMARRIPANETYKERNLLRGGDLSEKLHLPLDEAPGVGPAGSRNLEQNAFYEVDDLVIVVKEFYNREPLLRMVASTDGAIEELAQLMIRSDIRQDRAYRAARSIVHLFLAIECDEELLDELMAHLRIVVIID
ncbi:hypothetical protein PFISCL1PPCAC_12337, partial [Pristionchus fissidentatus]